MSLLLNFYPGDKFIFALGNILLQASAVIFAAWILATFAFRRNAAVRCNIWLIALMLVLLSPITAYLADTAGLTIFTVSLPNNSGRESAAAVEKTALLNSSAIGRNRPADFQEQNTTAIAEKPPVAAENAPGNIPIIAGSPPRCAFSQIDRLRAGAAPIIAIWGLGIIYLLIRLLRRGFAVQRLLQNMQIIDEHAGLRPVLSEIQRILQIDKLPRVYLWMDENIRISPFTAGIFRPVVVLPKNLLEILDRGELRDVLTHELAHILRRDPVIGLFQRFAEIMFWPFPPVWYMNRNLARAREEVCDNYVLKHTDNRRYAQTLFHLSRKIQPISSSLAPVGLFQYCWPLERRVAGLLDARRNVMTKIRPFTMCAVAAFFAALAIMVAGVKAQSPASPGKSNDAQPAVKRYEVNKLVKDFPENTDLSTPESAWAAYQRATANKDAKAILELSYWRESGPRELKATEDFFKEKDIDVYLQAVLNAEIIEVAVYHDDLANVISKLKFPEGVGRDPYSSRDFGKINGQWKNLGEDRSPSLEAAREEFDRKKDTLWKNFLETKDIVTGKKKPAKGGKLPPEEYAQAKAATPDAEKLLLMGLVENFFMHNARDVTARKSLEWGDVKKNPDGSRSIEYKFEARIWDRETMIGDEIFTFDKDNVIIGFEHVRPMQKKEPKKVDTSTKDGVIALVENFFAHNYRNYTSRETIEWGDPEKDKDGNVSIRYKYKATIWHDDTVIMNQVFTFDSKGEFVSVKDVEDNSVGEIQEKVYEVHKKVSDYPRSDDLTTPEAAYASIEHAYIAEGDAAFKRLSVPRMAEHMPQESKKALSKEQAEKFLNTEILEVHIWNENRAVVVALGTDSSYIDLRWLKRIDGKWLNNGNDSLSTIEQARQKIKKVQKIPTY